MFQKKNSQGQNMQQSIEQGLSAEMVKGGAVPEANKGPMTMDDMKSQIQDMTTLVEELLHNLEEIAKSMDAMSGQGA